MIEGYNIICFSTDDWNPLLPTNKFQLMNRFAKKNKIFYIETFGIRQPKIHISDFKRILNRLQQKARKKHSVPHSLTVISPKIIPSHSVLLRKLNQFLFYPTLKRQIKSHNFKNPILWIYNPYAVYYINKIAEPSLIVYHCVDDLALVPGCNKKQLINAERELLKKCDIVFATSPKLVERCSEINPNTYYQPNVADFAHFNSVENPKLEIHPNVLSLKPPVIMFSGNLAGHKVDVTLIRYIAEQHPNWSIAVLGPQWEGSKAAVFKSLKEMRNIYLFGHIPYLKLPNYLKGADVLIIPYLKNEVTENVFPLKFYEYLATGKPVVSTDLNTLKFAEEFIPLANNYDIFVKLCENYLEHPDENKSQRIELAQNNTWEKRIEEMSKIIEGKLK